MDKQLYHFLIRAGVADPYASALVFMAAGIVVLLLTLLATWLVRKYLVRAVSRFIATNRYHWDDALLKNRLLEKLVWFVPVTLIFTAQDLLVPADSSAAILLRKLLLCAFVIVTVRCLTALLTTINDIYRDLRQPGAIPIRGYVDAAKIITYVTGIIFVLAILTNRSPWGLLSVLGGLTAVTMLVFKDSILGFVASIQLTGTDMVRIGDWIEMPSYGADGDVTDISIHSVRVQNWDKTISTIPTYALITNAFKNWRGMSESGGRRIKRAINIDINSIHFAGDDELARFGRVALISDYVKQRQEEIKTYNREHGYDTGILINGRRQTNVGVFRAYIIAYLKNHPMINREMTFLVRHLPPGPEGLPIEIYVFSNDKVWASYEAIQADIFDHLLAALPMFNLRIFQNPTGYDFRSGFPRGPDGTGGANGHD